MSVDVTIHHNLGLIYVGGMADEIKDYDTDFLLVWEIEDLVWDLEYVNDLRYWYKMDDNDMDELGKPLTNDKHVVDFLNIVEIYELKSVHIYIEHWVDEPDLVGEVLFLPPLGPHLDEPDGDVQNGHVNDHANVGHAEGDAENAEGDANVEGNVGHTEGDDIYVDVEVEEAAASKTSKKKATRHSKKKAFVTKPKVVGKKKRAGNASERRKMRATTIRRGQDSGLTDVIDEEELQLSDFEITNDDDGDLFTVMSQLKMTTWMLGGESL
jgi:hypothetical protein